MMEQERLLHPEAEETEEPEVQEASDKPNFFAEVVNTCADYLYDYSWIMLLAAVILIIGYYIWMPSRYYFHSDTTDTLMWAAASYDAGALFDPEFAYACLLPFGTSLIMTALIPLFGVSMTTHVLGMMIFFLLFTAALMFMLRQMGWSWKWVSAGAAAELLMLSGSDKLREIFWGHTIYYSLSVLFLFVGLGLVFRYLELQGSGQRKKGSSARKGRMAKMAAVFLLLCIWYVLTCMNQLNAMTIFALPLLGGLFVERFLDEKIPLLSVKNLLFLIRLVVLVGCMVLGYFLTVKLADGIVPSYAESYSTYTPMEEWVDNAEKFPQQWFSLIGVSVRDFDPFLSAQSIINLLMIISGVIVLVLPVIALCCYRNIEDTKLKVLLLTYWCMTALILMGYICGRLSTANWRLSPILAMSVVVSVAFVRWAVEHTTVRRIMIVSTFPMILVCMVNAVTILKMPAHGYHDALLYRLADGLEERGLSYGYATFWQANGITVVSDSRVQCRNVSVDADGIRPYNYQSSQSWFYEPPEQEHYFLLLTEHEHRLLTLRQDPLMQLPYTEEELCGMYLWTFEENIFKPEPEEPEELLMPEDVLAATAAE